MAKTKNEIQRDYELRTNYQAQKKYHQQHGRVITFRVFAPQDNDIIERYESIPHKAEYIKDLIRADIEKNKR